MCVRTHVCGLVCVRVSVGTAKKKEGNVCSFLGCCSYVVFCPLSRLHAVGEATLPAYALTDALASASARHGKEETGRSPLVLDVVQRSARVEEVCDARRVL